MTEEATTDDIAYYMAWQSLSEEDAERAKQHMETKAAAQARTRARNTPRR